MNRLDTLKVKLNRFSYWLVVLWSGVLEVWGGVTNRSELGRLGAVGGGLAMMLCLLRIAQKRLVYPKGWLLYGGVILALGISILWSKDPVNSFRYLILFAGGGWIWLAAFNWRIQKMETLAYALLTLALGFSGIALFAYYWQWEPVALKDMGLVYPAAANHSHLGDVWMVAAVLLGERWLATRRSFWLVGMIPALMFMALSWSRSAVLALLTGFGYLAIKYFKLNRYRYVFIAMAIVLIGLGFGMSLKKETLHAREYFVQAVLGLRQHPWGVGMGNFKFISSDPDIQSKTSDYFSFLVHNLPLEMVAGMGFLGSMFWLFMGVSLYKGLASPAAYIGIQATLAALTVNFMFDTTYTTTTMLWLWFMLLGWAMPHTEQEKKPGLALAVGIGMGLLILVGQYYYFLVDRIKF